MNMIKAALADGQQAIKFLTSLGFRGLKFKQSEDGMIKYWYTGYDADTVKAVLGEPKSVVKSIRYDYKGEGTVAIWPQNKVVVLKDAARQIGQPSPEPTPPIPNPAAHTGVIHMPPELEKEYQKLRNHRGANNDMLAFNRRLWYYFNKTKFGNQMREPKFALMPLTDKMKTLGRWTPSRRLLEMNARHYFGAPELFTETFVHEMCHQAVSEIDQTEEAEHKGHGPKWRGWMIHVGLKPLAKDYNDSTAYKSRMEKLEIKDQVGVDVDKAMSKSEMISQLGLKRVTPVEGQRVYVPMLRSLTEGTAICMADAHGSKWAVLTDAQLVYAMTHGLPNMKWFLIERFNIFDNPNPSPINQAVLARAQAIIVKNYALRTTSTWSLG